MPVPLGVALPAAAAALAYINARAGVFYDMLLLGSAIPSAVKMAIREKRGRPNLFYLLEERAKSASTADRTFLLFEDRAYTYAQVYDRALRYGAWLKQVLAIEKGQVVAMDFMNSDTYIFIWMGLWAIGAKPAFINYNLKDQPLVHCVRAARAKILLVDPAVAANVEGVKDHLPGMQIKVVTPQLETEIMAMDAIRYPDELRHEDAAKNMAILIYTSGTTGLPKAAVISWAKLIVAGTFVNSWAGLKASDVYYTCMPMYHSSPTLMCFSAVLSTGCALALGVKFSNRTFWPDVRRHDATVIQYVGETCRYLLAAPPQLDPATGESLDRRHRVHTAFGNGLRPDVWAPFKERFGIETVAEFYGATEGMLATWNLSRNDFSAGAVGRHGWLYDLFMGRDVAFAALDDDAEQALRDPSTGFCRRARRGEPGELLFRLPAADIESRFQGYYGDSAASAAKVMRGVFKRGDAWFRTGDVMRADPGRGLLYFHDRIGDTYRWKSENVSTAEVAQGLGTHELVVEANVYGVALPGHDGRAGCAAVALPEGREPDEAGLAALAAHAQASLPRYAVPLFLRFVPPGAHTTGTNKQQKHVLREEGVDPDKTGGDKVFWLQDGRYVPFGRAEWLDLKGGRVKL